MRLEVDPTGVTEKRTRVAVLAPQRRSAGTAVPAARRRAVRAVPTRVPSGDGSRLRQWLRRPGRGRGRLGRERHAFLGRRAGGAVASEPRGAEAPGGPPAAIARSRVNQQRAGVDRRVGARGGGGPLRVAQGAGALSVGAGAGAGTGRGGRPFALLAAAVGVRPVVLEVVLIQVRVWEGGGEGVRGREGGRVGGRVVDLGRLLSI